MAITFIQKRKTQRYLVIVLALTAVLTGLIVWFGFFQEAGPGILIPEVSIPPKKIDIDFRVFEEPALLEMEDPDPEVSFPDEVGKKNPLLPLGEKAPENR